MAGLVLKLLVVLLGLAAAQDDAGMDMDMDSMLGGDTGATGDGAGPGTTAKKKTFEEESIDALKQLGFILGVAIMVGFMFFLMIMVEKGLEKVGEKYQEITGKTADPEMHEKDPASLVGSFSRYK